tara:strand:- start:11072 stop:11254 length:183 start_codon:yes stop_codon:yes gene_type:complete
MPNASGAFVKADKRPQIKEAKEGPPHFGRPDGIPKQPHPHFDVIVLVITETSARRVQPYA